MMIPNFNPLAFSQLSPRQRMISQLQGNGLGAFGVVGITHTNGGQVGVLTGTSRLGFLNAANHSEVGPTLADQASGRPVRATVDMYTGRVPGAPPMSIPGMNLPAPMDSGAHGSSAVNSLPPPPSGSPFSVTSRIPSMNSLVPVVDPCTGVMCPPDQYCSGGACVPSKHVVETTGRDKTLDTPSPSNAVDDTSDNGGYPTGSPNASPPDPYGSTDQNGPYPPSYPDQYGPPGYPPGLSPPAVNVQPSMAVQSSGIPWGWIAGGLALSFVAYKVVGRKR